MVYKKTLTCPELGFRVLADLIFVVSCLWNIQYVTFFEPSLLFWLGIAGSWKLLLRIFGVLYLVFLLRPNLVITVH